MQPLKKHHSTKVPSIKLEFAFIFICIKLRCVFSKLFTNGSLRSLINTQYITFLNIVHSDLHTETI